MLYGAGSELCGGLTSQESFHRFPSSQFWPYFKEKREVSSQSLTADSFWPPSAEDPRDNRCEGVGEGHGWPKDCLCIFLDLILRVPVGADFKNWPIMSGHPPQRRIANVGSILLTPQENEALFSNLGRKCIVSFSPSNCLVADWTGKASIANSHRVSCLETLSINDVFMALNFSVTSYERVFVKNKKENEA